ncbi:MAG: hypothetical protein WBO19_12005 [Terriglobia bacterium]
MATAAYWHATDILPDDILTAILELARRSSNQKHLTFRGHDSELQRLFWKLAQSCHNRFLEPFVFSDRGPEPYSPVLTESISRLQLSAFVGRDNPDYEVLFLRPAAEEYFDNELQTRLSKQDMGELQRVAEGFLSLIGVT